MGRGKRWKRGRTETEATFTLRLPLPHSTLSPTAVGRKTSLFNVFLSAGPIPLRIREARVPIVNDNECVRKINTVTEKIFILPASSFCAGGVKGHDACQVTFRIQSNFAVCHIFKIFAKKFRNFPNLLFGNFFHTLPSNMLPSSIDPQGDGGGPLVCEDSGYHELTGLFLRN